MTSNLKMALSAATLVAGLALTAPPALARGAESGSEIGAWSGLNNTIKLDSLSHKVEEYLPFGLIPSFVRQT